MAAALQPTAVSERISALDFLRGIAILGILLINAENFCYPDPWSPAKFGFENSSDHWTRFWVYFLTQGKSYSMLALLFGVGFYIFIERAEQKRSGVRAFELYGRRLIWLFVFGALHAYLIWDGDILHHYAVCGLLFFPFRSFRSTTLIFVLALAVSVILMNTYLYAQSNKAKYEEYQQAKNRFGSTRHEQDKQVIIAWEKEHQKESPDTTVTETPRRTYFESVAENAGIVKLHTGRIFNQGLLYRTLIMMVLGMLLYRSGIFTDYRSVKYYWVYTLLILGTALIVNYSRYYHWTFENHILVTSFWEEWLYTFPKESLGLAYILTFNGIYQEFLKRSRSSLISNVGRTALSNYIFQSLVCGLIFYGYGFGMYNRFSRTELLVVVASIWLVQIFLTWLWLRKFKYGPLEGLWRKLTYGNG